MAINLLTARRVATVIPQNKPYWLKDGGSLFLYVTPKGSRLWRYRYRIARQEGIYAIGRYPEVSLAAARRERDRARELVQRGVHPLLDKKLRFFQQLERNSNTFESMAESWIKTNKDWSENYKNQILSYMERDVYPAIGKLPVTAICAANLHPLIADIAERGSSAAMLVRQWVSQVFNYAVQQGLCEHDPAAMLKRVVKRPPVRHNPPLPWHEIPVFVKRLDGWNGHLITKLALRLVALTFVRTIEIRRASWDQFDFATATWHIPADNMKMRRAHIVPLSRQVLALLKELHAVTGAGRYLLPNARQPNAAWANHLE